MTSVIYDALASTDINNLLRRAVNIIAATLSTDHVLVQDLNVVDANSRFNASIGWDRITSVGLVNTLVELLRLPGTDELEDITPDDGQMQGRIHNPSPAFLEKYNLGIGMIVTVPCGDGILAVFASRSESGSDFEEADARFLFAIMNMLSMTVVHKHAELVHFRNMQQVIQAKHQWESTLDALPQLMCLIDENGHVIRINRTLEAWGLGDVTSVKGKQVLDVIHPGCSNLNCMLKANWKEMWQKLRNSEFVECENHDSSMRRDLHCSMCRSKKSQYDDGAEDEEYAFLVIEDISQQKQAERVLQDYNEELEKRLKERTKDLRKTNAALKGEIRGHLRDESALRESEKKYTCLVENTLTGLFVLQDEHIVFCNNRFAEIFGYSQEGISRMNTQQLFPLVESLTGAALNGPIKGTAWVSDERIVSGITRDGKTIWLQRNLTRVDCLNESMVMGNVIDITEQKNTEDDLRQSQRELQMLSEKLLQAQEEDRKRIASDLHDSIGQSISAVKFGMENAMREYKSVLPQSGMLYLQGAIEKLRDTIDEVRKISMNLRPSMLDDLGLQATIKWFTREFSSLFPAISVDTQIDVDESGLSGALKVVIFRVIQESLNNIGKHAEASNVSVELLNAGDKLTLSVKDDGKGFSPDTIYSGQGFGLSSMRERVKLTAGELAIESTPDVGTLVHAVWLVDHTNCTDPTAEGKIVRATWPCE
jgi:PAS domain S-box-containing protein